MRTERPPKRVCRVGASLLAPHPVARTLVAIAAALVMSTVAVGAAVGPASANANPVKVTLNA